MDATEEQRVRKFLTSAVRREVLPDPVWDVLVGAGHICDLREGKITEGELIDYTRALLLYGDIVEQAESRPEPRQRKPTPDPPCLIYEQERAITRTSYLSLKVNTHPSVLRFRRKRFKDPKLLSREVAFELAKKSEYRVALSESQDPDYTTQSGSLEMFTGEPEVRQRVEFEAGSFLAELHKVSLPLCEELVPLGGEAEAAWAVVTGEVREASQPLVGEVTNRSNAHITYGTIHLTVEPWVATESVVKVYQWLQAQMLGRKPRALIERNLRVVQFVMGALEELVFHGIEDDAPPPRLSWRKLTERWNVANPQEAYTEERHFHRDFYQTANAVVRPYDARNLIDQLPDFPLEK